jgi:uncharacterized protein (TIGR03084 family)
MAGTLMAIDYQQIVADLRDETKDLEHLLHTLTPTDWALPTPAAGWSIQDQLNHLAYFDEATALAITDPEKFNNEATALMAGPSDFPNELVVTQRHMSPEATREWFRTARGEFLDLTAKHDPATRLPWYRVSMSLSSSVTARIMETWAHGQDVADALEIERTPTPRLRHICHLGVATRGFSYRLNGLHVPDADVRVELRAPDGGIWSWGPDEADQTVNGPALDFCLVVTQRRNIQDTTLRTVGEAATQWMNLAQAFAGARGTGRSPTSKHPS